MSLTKRDKSKADRSPIEICVAPATILRFGVPVIFAIVVAGALANAAMFQWIQDPEAGLFKLLKRFDLTTEPSLPSWFSSIVIVGCSVLLGVIAVGKFKVRDRFRFHWFGLSVLFLLLGLDEGIMIHEMLVSPTKAMLNTSGIFSIAWIIPGSLFVLVVGFVFLNFVLNLPPYFRKRIIAAGVIFLTGAILMEMPGGVLYEKYGFETWHYITSYAIEEFLEMFAMLWFATILMRYLDEGFCEVRFRAEVEGASQQ